MSGGGIFDFIRTAKKEDIEKINKANFDIMMGKIKQEIPILMREITEYRDNQQYTVAALEMIHALDTDILRKYNELLMYIRKQFTFMKENIKTDGNFETLQIYKNNILKIEDDINTKNEITSQINNVPDYNLLKKHLYLTEKEYRMLRLLSIDEKTKEINNPLIGLEDKKYTIKRVKQILKCYYDELYKTLDETIGLDKCVM